MAWFRWLRAVRPIDVPIDVPHRLSEIKVSIARDGGTTSVVGTDDQGPLFARIVTVEVPRYFLTCGSPEGLTKNSMVNFLPTAPKIDPLMVTLPLVAGITADVRFGACWPLLPLAWLSSHHSRFSFAVVIGSVLQDVDAQAASQQVHTEAADQMIVAVAAE
jgi:hypothetical protein